MDTRMIKPVSSAKDKQRTYSEQMTRYNKAIRGEFYLEALLIDYAMLEDRLYAILYHMAFIANRKTLKIWKKTKPYFSSIVEKYKDPEEALTISAAKMNSKLKVVRCILRWASTTERSRFETPYLCALKHQCERLDIAVFLSILDKIEQWCSYRNEVIHALLNKNTDSLYSELKTQATCGMEYARFLDAQEKLIKRGNKIRKSVNAPNT